MHGHASSKTGFPHDVAHISILTLDEPRHEKTCFMPYVNNKGADQPVHPHNLISAFVVHCLDSTMPIGTESKILRLAGLWSKAGRFES